VTVVRWGFGAASGASSAIAESTSAPDQRTTGASQTGGGAAFRVGGAIARQSRTAFGRVSPGRTTKAW
jgi:hypothetical protein